MKRKIQRHTPRLIMSPWRDLFIGTKGAAPRVRTLRNARHRFFQLDSSQRFCKSKYISCCLAAALPISDIPRLDSCFLTSLSWRKYKLRGRNPYGKRKYGHKKKQQIGASNSEGGSRA